MKDSKLTTARVMSLALLLGLTLWLADAVVDYLAFNPHAEPFTTVLRVGANAGQEAGARESVTRSIYLLLTLAAGYGIVKARRGAPSSDQKTRSQDHSESLDHGWFPTLFHRANDAFLVAPLSADGTPGFFEEVNETAVRLLGYSRERLSTMRGRDLAGEPGAAWTQAVASELLDRGTTTFETTVRTGDGRQLPLEVSAHRFTEGGRTLVLAVARDISERRQWEAETHRLNHALRTMLDIHGHITGTHSEKEMLEHACYEFTETRSFREAWSITLDEQWAVGNLAHAGLEEAGARFEAHLHTAGLPPCAADALRRRATVVHRPSPEYCQGCPLYPRNRSGSNACTVIASPMRYGDTVLGVLGAGVDEGWIRQGEQELFEQVTADLALALNNARTQTALSESEQRYRHMVEEAPIGIFRSTVSGRLLFANLTLARMFGFASAEELVQTYVDLGSQAYQDPEDRREFLDLLQRNGRVHGFEKAFRTRDGDTLWGSLYARLWSPESGGEQLIDGFIQDRSQAKHAEEKLRKTLREREVLLKEVHHRVRNNLNVIVSLLHLRSNTLTDTEDALEAFRETENRIRSMAHIHSSLYESGESGTIDVEDYIKSLVNAVLLSYDIGASVAVEYRLEHIELGFSVAMPVGLIVHEAVSNALKHAFSSEDNGHIVVTLTRKSSEHCLLRVADNGFGLPAHAFEPQAESLGVALMHSLAEQLGGGLSMESNEGAVISVLFPCPEEQPIELHSEEDQDA